MKQIKYIVLFSIQFFLFSCGIHKQDNVISTDHDVSFYDDEQFFLPNQDGYIYLCDGYQLIKLYKRMYSDKYINYQRFKRAVIEGMTSPPLPPQMTIKTDSVDYFHSYEHFSPDTIVLNDYKVTPFDEFKVRYCSSRNGRLEFIMHYPFNSRMTIAYCLWLHGFYYSNDSYTGNEFFVENSTLNPIRSK